MRSFTFALIACAATASKQGGEFLGPDFQWGGFLDQAVGNKDGTITLDEIVGALNAKDGAGAWDWIKFQYGSNPNGWMQDPMILGVIVQKLMDGNNDGKLSQNEAGEFVTRAGGDAQALGAIWSKYDYNGNGYLSDQEATCFMWEAFNSGKNCPFGPNADGGDVNPQPTPTPEPTPAPGPEPTPSPEPTPAPGPEPTPTPEPTPAPGPEPEPTPTPTPGPDDECDGVWYADYWKNYEQSCCHADGQIYVDYWGDDECCYETVLFDESYQVYYCGQAPEPTPTPTPGPDDECDGVWYADYWKNYEQSCCHADGQIYVDYWGDDECCYETVLFDEQYQAHYCGQAPEPTPTPGPDDECDGQMYDDWKINYQPSCCHADGELFVDYWGDDECCYGTVKYDNYWDEFWCDDSATGPEEQCDGQMYDDWKIGYEPSCCPAGGQLFVDAWGDDECCLPGGETFVDYWGDDNCCYGTVKYDNYWDEFWCDE